MFLNRLNQQQKELFIQLTYCAAIANGEFHEKEKAMLNAYCAETGVNFDINNAITDYVSIVNELNIISDINDKKIILFEILGLLLSDSEYDNLEKDFAEKVREIFGLDQEFSDSCINLLKVYFSTISDMQNLVIG